MPTISNDVIKAAQETQKKYGVPASVTIAQWALESAYGTSNVARNANNYFGIKKGSSWTGKTYGMYRAYDSMQQSFDDHGKLLTRPIYANKTKNAKSAEEYIRAIAETYAPTSDGNVNYSGQIMSIINRHNLTQYDNGKYGGGGITVTGDTITTDTNTNDSAGFFDKILSGVINITFIVVLVILAFVFFINAFDIKIGGIG